MSCSNLFWLTLDPPLLPLACIVIADTFTVDPHSNHYIKCSVKLTNMHTLLPIFVNDENNVKLMLQWNIPTEYIEINNSKSTYTAQFKIFSLTYDLFLSAKQFRGTDFLIPGNFWCGNFNYVSHYTVPQKIKRNLQNYVLAEDRI
mgnify:CR=1 FL=1